MSRAITGAPVEAYLRHLPAFEVQERIMPMWDEVTPRRDLIEVRNTNTDGGTAGAAPPTSPLHL